MLMFTSDDIGSELVSDNVRLARATDNLEVPMPDSRRVIALLNDLMFTVKIQEAAKRAGFEVVFVKSGEKVVELADENPSAIILDLNYADAKPLDLISALKGDEKKKKIPLIGYVAHVQVDRRQAAQTLGCDLVVARSAFVQNLPELLQRVTEADLKSTG
jgi:CheY-like chemotaxis protein